MIVYDIHVLSYIAGPTIITSCNIDLSCEGADIPLTSTGAAAQVRECCMDTAGLSYSLLGQCFDCNGEYCVHVWHFIVVLAYEKDTSV